MVVVATGTVVVVVPEVVCKERVSTARDVVE